MQKTKKNHWKEGKENEEERERSSIQKTVKKRKEEGGTDE